MAYLARRRLAIGAALLGAALLPAQSPALSAPPSSAIAPASVVSILGKPFAIPVAPPGPAVVTVSPAGQGNAILAFTDPAGGVFKIAAPASESASLGYPAAPIPIGQAGFFYVTGPGANAKVLVGGVEAQVLFVEQAPGLPGIDRIDIVIPNGAPSGDAIPLQIQSSDGKNLTRPGATIAIAPAESVPILQPRRPDRLSPVPSISALSPSAAPAGGNSLTLTITGGGFVRTSAVTFNGVPHGTSFVSDRQLTIALTASDLSLAGNFPVVVTNPPPGGGASNAANFIVAGGSISLSPGITVISSGTATLTAIVGSPSTCAQTSIPTACAIYDHAGNQISPLSLV